MLGKGAEGRSIMQDMRREKASLKACCELKGGLSDVKVEARWLSSCDLVVCWFNHWLIRFYEKPSHQVVLLPGTSRWGSAITKKVQSALQWGVGWLLQLTLLKFCSGNALCLRSVVWAQRGHHQRSQQIKAALVTCAFWRVASFSRRWGGPQRLAQAPKRRLGPPPGTEHDAHTGVFPFVLNLSVLPRLKTSLLRR